MLSFLCWVWLIKRLLRAITCETCYRAEYAWLPLILRLLLPAVDTVHPECNYKSRQKSWHAHPLFQYLSRKFISSPPPFPPIQCCLSWWSCHCSFPTLSGGGEVGVPYSSDSISPLVIVSKIACQRMFQLSNPGVPRTFVEDYSLL